LTQKEERSVVHAKGEKCLGLLEGGEIKGRERVWSKGKKMTTGDA